ncbi:MAG TPA: YqgE/AlgH family protein [Gammaproteobacteria bacterium]|nr:YqgE/AlgH family protein [Gammaproteobacteria bacterium]
MINATSLQNHFLIAMPSLADPNFQQSVTYVCEHNEQGAMGIIINRPLEIQLGDVLQHMDIETDDPRVADQIVYLGGPVHTERGFVLHRPPGRWEAMLEVSDSIGITTSQDILSAIALGEGPDRAVVALGYAGWGPGQLEKELLANAWLSGPADLDLMFSTPVEQRWNRAAGLLGIDLSLLSREAGHA